MTSSRSRYPSISRRQFLGAAIATVATTATSPLFAQTLPRLLPKTVGRRVVVIGAGWAGLAAARGLRELAPELEVVLLERGAVFRSGPLSNKWLVDRIGEDLIVHDYRAAAAAFGYTFVQAQVNAIDRDRRCVVTPQGTVDYDWLVLAAGVRRDFSPWYGDDANAAAHTVGHYPCAFAASDELPRLKAKLAAFAGGDFVVTIPPGPYRCPPAPYERIGMIAAQFRARKLKARLIVVDAGPGLLDFPRLFVEHYKDWITYLPQSRLTSVDPFARRVVTDFEDIRFDDAILMPPQQAADLVWQAGLIGRDEAGRPTGWAEQHPVHLHALSDDRIFLIGDLMGRVSPLFGHYTKTGQTAARLGRIAAREIAARARGREPERVVPDSVCYVVTNTEPMEMTRIESEYRLRGESLIAQTSRQTRDPQPRGEDEAWAKDMFKELLAYRA